VAVWDKARRRRGCAGRSEKGTSALPSTSARRPAVAQADRRHLARPSAASICWSTTPAILGPVGAAVGAGTERIPPRRRRQSDRDLSRLPIGGAAPAPKRAGPNRGRIVNISSIQAKEGLTMSQRLRGHRKPASLALTKTLGKRAGARGEILVNCITPRRGRRRS